MTNQNKKTKKLTRCHLTLQYSTHIQYSTGVFSGDDNVLLHYLKVMYSKRDVRIFNWSTQNQNLTHCHPSQTKTTHSLLLAWSLGNSDVAVRCFQADLPLFTRYRKSYVIAPEPFMLIVQKEPSYSVQRNLLKISTECTKNISVCQGEED